MSHNQCYPCDFTLRKCLFSWAQSHWLKTFPIFQAENSIKVDEHCLACVCGIRLSLAHTICMAEASGRRKKDERFLALIKLDGSLGPHYAFHSWLWWNEEPLCL